MVDTQLSSLLDGEKWKLDIWAATWHDLQADEKEKKMMALMRERYSIGNYGGKALYYLWVDLKVALS